jgi:hypothetical protein
LDAQLLRQSKGEGLIHPLRITLIWHWNSSLFECRIAPGDESSPHRYAMPAAPLLVSQRKASTAQAPSIAATKGVVDCS